MDIRIEFCRNSSKELEALINEAYRNGEMGKILKVPPHKYAGPTKNLYTKAY